MRQNIFDPSVKEDILGRINKLTPASGPIWGKLSSSQMIRHLAEACKLGINEVYVPDQSNLVTRSLVKWLFLRNVKPPGREKGNIKTFPEIDIVALGIIVNDIQQEKENYQAVLDRLTNTKELNKKHPLFGKMSRDDWGYLTYAHADYHLTQFNV